VAAIVDKGEAQHEHYQCDLKPDQATDLTKDEFHAWTPWRRHGVTRGFDSALHQALRARKKLWPLIEGGYNQHPRQDHR
jgi:hypothetical protein